MWKRRKFVFCLVVLQLWLIEAASSKVDICSSLCRCVNESHFVKIHCDFNDNKVSHAAVLIIVCKNVYVTHKAPNSSKRK